MKKKHSIKNVLFEEIELKRGNDRAMTITTDTPVYLAEPHRASRNDRYIH